MQIFHRRKKESKEGRERGREEDRKAGKERERVREAGREMICTEQRQHTRRGARPFQAHQTLKQCCYDSIWLTFTDKETELRVVKQAFCFSQIPSWQVVSSRVKPDQPDLKTPATFV